MFGDASDLAGASANGQTSAIGNKPGAQQIVWDIAVNGCDVTQPAPTSDAQYA